MGPTLRFCAPYAKVLTEPGFHIRPLRESEKESLRFLGILQIGKLQDQSPHWGHNLAPSFDGALSFSFDRDDHQMSWIFVDPSCVTQKDHRHLIGSVDGELAYCRCARLRCPALCGPLALEQKKKKKKAGVETIVSREWTFIESIIR